MTKEALDSKLDRWIAVKPLSYEKKFLTDSLSEQTAKKGDNLHKLTMLLDRFDEDYQSFLDKKAASNG